ARGSWQHVFLVSRSPADRQHCLLRQRCAARQLHSHRNSSGCGRDRYRAGQPDCRLSVWRQGRVWLNPPGLCRHDRVRGPALPTKPFVHSCARTAGRSRILGRFLCCARQCADSASPRRKRQGRRDRRGEPALIRRIGGAAGVYYVVQHYSHLSPPALFLSASLVTVAAAVYVLYLLPDALIRLLLGIATHTLYRIHLEGRDNVPAKGGALIVSNHVSMVDAVLLIASIDRPIRFLMFKGSYDHPLVKPFAKIMGVIPISSQLRPREMIQSLRTATQALQDGEIVCIFPEGQMTRIGQMLPFRRGMERIVKGVDVPIIPVNLGGVW